MKYKIFLLSSVLLAITTTVTAQVKIGNNPTTIDTNSLLELETTNKGFLPPRVALTSVSSVSPLTGTVPTGMLVYSTGGSVADGYYFWDGSQWVPFKGESGLVVKTANATLTKNEKFVLASNSITLTLPSIAAADNGLSITIKNNGVHTHLVTVAGNGASTIDGISSTTLHRWVAKTLVAYNGNWLTKGNDGKITDNVFEVSANSSWTSVSEILEFLNLHIAGPSVIKLVGGDYSIAATQVVNLAYPVTFQGSSYGAANIVAASGLAGTPMFRCQSETYFKMLAFDATTLAGYGGASGEDAIHFETAGTYYEVKDCTIDGFNKGILAKSNVEMWIFELDISNCAASGIEVAAGATSGVSLKISETDFIACGKGINLLSGTNPVVSILNCGFYNNAGQVGIDYDPATFTSLSRVFITNNTWNNTGTFMNGFDFSRADGRDANTFVKNNSGGQDQNPHCRINVTNNTSTTTVTTAGTWYKANWTNTSSITTKWTIANNRITYQPVNRSNGWAIITGNISVNANNRTVSICIVKNGVTTTRYGESDLRLGTAGDPYQFTTTVYLPDMGPTDYFEVFCTSSTSGDIITFRDVQWFTETK